jgi:hypothetical protein
MGATTQADEIDFSGRELVIQGNNTVLDAGCKGRFFTAISTTAKGKTSLELRGIVMQNGCDRGPPAGDGGAIAVVTTLPGSLVLRNTKFITNRAGWNGGAICIYAALFSMEIYDSDFVGSFAGGGTYGGAAICTRGVSFIIQNSTFEHNKESQSRGGALFIDGGSANISGCTFENNTDGAGTGGGAILASGNANVLIAGCNFVHPISQFHNDISNDGGNVTFECADGEIGTPVQMQGTEITIIPPKELKCTKPKPTPAPTPAPKYTCDYNTLKCKEDPHGESSSMAECSKVCCAVPLNCGMYNNTEVCGHKYSTCDVCAACCHPWLKPQNICDGCVADECTSGRQPDCCVSFECVGGKCQRAFRAEGKYPSSVACKAACA